MTDDILKPRFADLGTELTLACPICKRTELTFEGVGVIFGEDESVALHFTCDNDGPHQLIILEYQGRAHFKWSSI